MTTKSAFGIGRDVNNRYLRIGSALAAIGLGFGIFLGADGFGRHGAFGPPWDKLAHFAYYGAIGALLAIALGRRWFLGALLFVALLGALDEWNQFYIPGRQSSFFDWLADVLGAVFALYLYRRWLLSGAPVNPASASRTIPPASA
jgi:VanZ like family